MHRSFLFDVVHFSIVFLVLQKGPPLLNLQVFTQLPPAPGLTGGGFGNAIQGTVVMVLIALLLSTPLGVLSAIYVSEYNPRSRLASIVRFVAKLLTGIPSIICGVFAFSVVVLSTGTSSALAGGVALAVLTLPTILLTTEQALLGVPKALREASYGLGATRYQTIVRIVLPEALPAIMTGVMLAVARAAGKTAPVLLPHRSATIGSVADGTGGLCLYSSTTFLLCRGLSVRWRGLPLLYLSAS